jgi:hypothetical protein
LGMASRLARNRSRREQGPCADALEALDESQPCHHPRGTHGVMIFG